MITGLYAALIALFYVRLSLIVVRLRRKYQVSLGDGGVEALQQAISVHGNASQYIPITLLLMFFLEYQQVSVILVHLAGMAMLAGRLLHASAITTTNFKKRRLGMQLTLFTIIGLALVNIGTWLYVTLLAT
jgi:uncharacterized membrane protein YecN with MAPEG domain